MADSVYWIGQDGNVWFKDATGTRNVGKPLQSGQNSFDAERLSAEAQQIADPLAGQVNGVQTNVPNVRRTTTVANGNASASAEPAKVLNQAAVDNTQKAIGSLDAETAIGNQNIDDSYTSVVGKYDTEANKAKSDFEENTVTNNQNLQKNKQNALVAAAQGRKGLRGTLASIGALSGDGAFLADRAVAQGANEDIGGATDTATTNATALTKAMTNFEDEDRQRRAEAQTARDNSKTELEGRVLSKKQQYYQKLAELYNDGGDTTSASSWLNKAGDLNTPIAQKSAVKASPITAKSAAFTPGQLESYLAGNSDMTVDVAPGGEGSASSVLATRKKRDEEKQLMSV